MSGLLAKLLGIFRSERPDVAKPQPEDQDTGETSPLQHPFVPQNELERLLVLAIDGPGNRQEFQQFLMQSQLYAVRPDASEAVGSRVLERDEAFSLVVVELPNGQRVPAVFTSEARLAQVYGPGVAYLSMNATDLFNVIAADGVFINPHLAYGVHYDAEALANLLGRPVKIVMEKDTRVMLGVPSETPTRLIQNLRMVFEAEPAVSEAWLALAKWPDTDRVSWFLDVRSGQPSLDTDEMMAKVMSACEPQDLMDMGIDLVLNTLNEPPGAGIRIVPAQTQ